MNERFRFGLFEFDAGALELRRDGALVRLQAQPAQVLAALLAQAGHVVSREELRDAIWGDGTHVDFERGLNFCVGQVRAVLGDDSASPRFVRTVPKRGYQFVAPVARTGTRQDALGPVHAGVPARRFNPPSAIWIWSSVVLVALAVGAGYLLRSWQMARRMPVVAVVRFDNETNDSRMAAFADGLTDNVVEELTRLSRQRYAVIGNAAILRVAREQRDLREIAGSLRAGYIVLGQVQNAGDKTRILAHLIRMPDQTHVWVTRMDRSVEDLLGVESEVAERVARDFSEGVARDSSGAHLPEFASR